MNSELQRDLERILERYTASDEELGVQCAVWRHGELQASACAGHCDEGRTRPVEEESLFPVFSTGKALFSTLALRIVEKHGLPLDTKLGDYWPAFAVEGTRKSRITLRDALRHTTGMHVMPAVESAEALVDWEGMCGRLAAREPVWEPGTRTQYQALSYAWILGEFLHRVTGVAPGELMRREILEPLGLSRDVFFGVPESQDARIGEVVAADDMRKFLPPKNRESFLDPLFNAMSIPCVRQAFLPSFGCVANARGLARFGGALLEGGMISPGLLEEATTLQRPAEEAIPSENQDVYWMIFGLGYLLLAPPPWRGRLFGHHGWGGSELTMDQRTGAVFAIVKNRLSSRVVQPMKTQIHALADALWGK